MKALKANGVNKPRKIMKELNRANLPMLSNIQISNLKGRENLKINGKSTCNLSNWFAWIKKRTDVPDDEDELFVADYSYEFSRRDPSKLKDIRCFFTTKRLISVPIKSK